MKHYIGKILEFFLALLPARVRMALCSLLFSSETHSSSDNALKQLMKIQDVLSSCVDKAAINYEGGVLHPKHRLTGYHDFFVKRIKDGENVLDVGCGVGILAHSIVQSGAKVIGIDIDEEKINYATQHYVHQNLSFICGDVVIELPDETFEVIVLSNVLEHIDKRVELLITIKERFAPQRFLIRVPMFNRSWEVPLKKELGLPYFSDITHYTEYTVDTFEQEINCAGLRVEYLQIIWGEIWAEIR